MSEVSGTDPKNRVWLWVAIIAVVIVVAGGIWMFTRGLGTPLADGTEPGQSQGPVESNGPGQTPGPAPTPQPMVVDTPAPGETTPIEKPAERPEVAIDQPVTIDQGSSVEVVSVTAITAGRDIPGEKSGPAVQVVIRVTNGGDAVINTAGSSINLTYNGDDRTPAPALIGDDSRGLPESIPVGDSAEGTFVFAVPLVSDGDIRIIVDILASESDVVFAGQRP